MRKVTEKAALALLRGENMRSGNTVVRDYAMFLHGNKIAERWEMEDFTQQIVLSDCGWQTATTKERLNGILEVFRLNMAIVQRNGQWLLNTYDRDNNLIRQSVWHGQRTIEL